MRIYLNIPEYISISVLVFISAWIPVQTCFANIYLDCGNQLGYLSYIRMDSSTNIHMKTCADTDICMSFVNGGLEYLAENKSSPPPIREKNRKS